MSKETAFSVYSWCNSWEEAGLILLRLFIQGFITSRAWLEVNPRSDRVIKSQFRVTSQTGQSQKQTGQDQGRGLNKGLGNPETCSFELETHMRGFKSLKETRNR